MNIKLTALSAAILASVSTLSAAQTLVPSVPDAYVSGPTRLQFVAIDMSAAERAGYALAESAMQIAEASILANDSCAKSVGTWKIKNYWADGADASPTTNTLTIDLGSEDLILRATLSPYLDFYGQTIEVNSDGNVGQKLAGIRVKNFANILSFNDAGTIMTGYGSVEALGINNGYDEFNLDVIKDFYKDDAASDFEGRPVIYDWGLQSVSKIGYPVNKYWQRSVAQRKDGVAGFTHYVKDRLVGSSVCHIDFFTGGVNVADYFSQVGKLTISQALPFDPTAVAPSPQAIDPLLAPFKK